VNLARARMQRHSREEDAATEPQHDVARLDHDHAPASRERNSSTRKNGTPAIPLARSAVHAVRSAAGFVQASCAVISIYAAPFQADSG
jgi:hypothetical protein